MYIINITKNKVIKNKIKIVLSLLVAIAFMLPASSVLGGNTTEKVNAGNTQIKTTRTIGMDQLSVMDPVKWTTR
jgi:hypothetical protein